MKIDKMSQAKKMRYNKIELLTNLLCKENAILLDYSPMDSLDKPFNVGRRITVEGQNIIINKKTYSALEIKKVTISTEGSFSIYDRSGKKLCGWSVLNLSTKNVGLFCLWVRKNGIPAETVSGRAEKAFQLGFCAAVTIVVILIKILLKII